MPSEDEIIDIADKHDNIISQARRSIAISKGLLHRSVNVFLFNRKGELFLQQRSAHRPVCPLAWDLSASEHVKSGETYQEAASRSLAEELGIKSKVTRIRPAIIEKHVYHGGKTKEYELVELYKATYDGEFKLDSHEVVQGRFFAISQIKKMLKENPGQFTPWFLDEWKWMEKNGLV
ncbi:MAG: NUDIX domain-containing protein [Candidatus Aenigmarchaeota archaeon]|nr:NUDIX domain-containing protein [Candidatus Aenigmarchaeota archaeon]